MGSFWVDLTRVTLYLLLPISIVYAIYLIAAGVPQTLAGGAMATTLEGAQQDVALGPIASQIAIKMLGTNGGGFLNANAAHPFENPDALCNFIQMVSIFAIGAGTDDHIRPHGRQRTPGLGDPRRHGAVVHDWASAFATGPKHKRPPRWRPRHIDPRAGNLEGKETRFGLAASALFAVVTTAASCGAVNAMHDSFTAIGGMVPLVNIQLGEVIVGGVGAGFYGILLFIVLSLFIAGLMVGRTPSFLGKKIEAREVKLVVLSIFASPLVILLTTALAASTKAGLAGPLNAGPHGFSEILYAFSSAGGNNGSAFAGLTATSDFYLYALAVAMFVGRFVPIVGALAVAGALAAKPSTPQTSGTFPTARLLFILLVAAVILIEGALTFFRLCLSAPWPKQPPIRSTEAPMTTATSTSLFDTKIIGPAFLASFAKLNPLSLWRNPVVFAIEVIAIYVTILFARDIATGGSETLFSGQIAFWLWATVLFAAFAEAVAEGRGKAQAASLRRARAELTARVIINGVVQKQPTSAADLKLGDMVEIIAGEFVPADGEVVEGVATVDESAITGESAPVIRESGGDRSAVTAGTRVLSDRIVVKVVAVAGSTFLDRMIALVGRRRAAQNAERNRAQRVAGRPVANLRARRGDHSELRRLRQRPGERGRASIFVHRAYPDHHRRLAFGHRHRRYGPPGAIQRAGDVWPRGRGRRRC